MELKGCFDGLGGFMFVFIFIFVSKSIDFMLMLFISMLFMSLEHVFIPPGLRGWMREHMNLTSVPKFISSQLH